MNHARQGFALPAAIAALIVLSALAALSTVAARVSLREAAALAAEAQANATRAAVRSRAVLVLSRASRGELLAAPRLIAERDTALTILALAWPWHRVSVTVSGGAPIIAELARAIAPALPWCAAVVAGGSSTVAPNAVSLDAGSSCTEASSVATPVAIAAFGDSLTAGLVLGPLPDSATVYASGAPAVIRARRCVAIAAGASVTGVVIAPVVTLETGAAVRGIVIASETLTIAVGATAIGDEHAANSALYAYAKLRLLGRAGLLSPP